MQTCTLHPRHCAFNSAFPNPSQSIKLSSIPSQRYARLTTSTRAYTLTSALPLHHTPTSPICYILLTRPHPACIPQRRKLCSPEIAMVDSRIKLWRRAAGSCGFTLMSPRESSAQTHRSEEGDAAVFCSGICGSIWCVRVSRMCEGRGTVEERENL